MLRTLSAKVFAPLIRKHLLNRTGAAVLIGLLASGFALSYALALYDATTPRQDFRTVAFFYMLVAPAVVLWLPLASLAVWLVSRLGMITLFGTICSAICAYLALFAFLFTIKILDHGNIPLAGDPCGGGQGRFFVTDPDGTGARYLECLPRTEYDTAMAERRAKEPPFLARLQDGVAKLVEDLTKLRVIIAILAGGIITATAGWLFAFGWRWQAWAGELRSNRSKTCKPERQD